MEFECKAEQTWREKILKGILDFADYCLHPFFKTNIDIKKINKVLIMRQDRIGDLVLTSPFFYNLKKNFPQWEVHLMIAPGMKDLIAENPYIDRIIEKKLDWFYYEQGAGSRISQFIKTVLSPSFRDFVEEIKKEKYQLAVDLAGKRRNALALLQSGIPYRIGCRYWGGSFLYTHRIPFREDIHYTELVLSYLEPLGITQTEPVLKLYPAKINNEELINKYKFYKKYNKTVVGVNINAPVKKGKLWSKENWKELLKRLLQDNRFTILVYFAKNEKELAEEIAGDLSGEGNRLFLVSPPSLSALVEFMKCLDVTLCVDSGPVHIASALDIPAVALFGGDNPTLWSPFNKERSRVLRKVSGESCKSICRDSACINAISPEEVYTALMDLLSAINMRV